MGDCWNFFLMGTGGVKVKHVSVVNWTRAQACSTFLFFYTYGRKIAYIAN